MLEKYYEKVVKGTENEDSLVIVQALKPLVGQRFSFLGYYKEIPVSYDAKLLSVENEMAEFEVHDYQAKVISMQRKALIYSHEKLSFREDLSAEVFYVNISRKRVILCKFAYARICSNMRRFVRVELGDFRVEADVMHDGKMSRGLVKDISLGGAAVVFSDGGVEIPAGAELELLLRLPGQNSSAFAEVRLTANLIRIMTDNSPHWFVLEFQPEKQSQQQIAYFINQRQVEIIKELKEVIV